MQSVDNCNDQNISNVYTGLWYLICHKLCLLLNVYIMCSICINVYYEVLLGIINFTKLTI